MSQYRAILVSKEQRDRIVALHLLAALPFADAFDAAGDRSRIRWCAEHGGPIRWADGQCIAFYKAEKPCRMVDAIVVPVEEQS